MKRFAFGFLVTMIAVGATVSCINKNKGGADPRFTTCAEAKAAGYGSYIKEDNEYQWYPDGDGDGVACE